MGGGLAFAGPRQGHPRGRVRPSGTTAELVDAGVTRIGKLAEFAESARSRPAWCFAYIPAGPAVDTLLAGLSDELDKGDIIVDGGNSYWGDTIKRAQKLAAQGHRPRRLPARRAASKAHVTARASMVGGTDKAVERIEPILVDLAVKGGYGPRRAGRRRAFYQARPQRHRARHDAGDRRGRRFCSSASSCRCRPRPC